MGTELKATCPKTPQDSTPVFVNELFTAVILTAITISWNHKQHKCCKYININILPLCVCMHMHVLTCTVLFAHMLGHRYLSVYDRFALQNILIMAIGHRLLFTWRAVMLCPVTVAVGPINLGEDGSFIEQSKVSLKVKVCVEVFLSPISKALVVLWPHRTCSTTIPHTIFLWCGLCCPSDISWSCRSWRIQRHQDGRKK